ncbi:MAG: hypothetical protein IJ539_07425 [Prevotella sp.]|nr:hypothetical protein [Prevotella sp.]
MTLPEDFISETRQLMGDERFERLLLGLQQEAPVSIRINERKPIKSPSTFKRQQSSSLVPHSSPVPWCPTGFYLDERPNFTFDPLLHAGCYYVQEASSMFIDHVVRTLTAQSPSSFSHCLDLCASPGGKSTCLRSILPDDCILYSNEPIRPRAQVLNENILKWGHPGVVVTNNYARDYRKSGLPFDLILTDVPCSGEGMFRKDPQAIAEWSLQKVIQCQQLQREIVNDIWPCLKPGGILIYSTCTFNRHENEDNVQWIARELGADFITIPVEASWGITGSLTEDIPVYRFLPGYTRGEGLFMAVLKKSTPQTSSHKPQTSNLRILSHGPLSPTQKGKDLIPDVSEALSIDIKNKYARVEVTWQQAIQYLRKEAITLPADTPRGIVMVCFEGHPLGFAKNIGNRANNLYPSEWRIMTTHIPAQYQHVL